MAVAPAAAAIIWFIASPAADRSSSDSSSAPSTSIASMPIMAAARRRTPSRVITKMLPPVTPFTYETLAATAGTGIERSGDSPFGTTATWLRSTTADVTISSTCATAVPVDSASLISASSVVTGRLPAVR